MPMYGGENYTTFKGVNFKNTAFIRMELDGGFNGTVSAKASPDADRAWQFPDKSGTFPIMGTFGIQIPAVVGTHYSTICTVSGIRAEDALIVQFNGPATGTTYGFEQATGHIIKQVKAGNGNITVYLQNPGNSTAYVDLVASYLACR